ncbi:MAG: NIPSNAP family protein [Aeromicrobium sp.]
MITVHLTYIIDPSTMDQFEEYARRWISLINRFGGDHHGYFMPSEGASDVAYALYSFPSLAAYEQYRTESFTDPDCLEANAIAERAECIHSWTRTFMRPVTDGI